MAELIEFAPNRVPAALFTAGAPPTFITCEHICFNILKDAQQCSNGHNFCKVCVETWKRASNECPVCKATLTLMVPNRAIDEAVADAIMMCFTRLDADGNVINSSMTVSSRNGGDEWEEKTVKVDLCDWVGKIKDAEEHFKVCQYAGVRCPYEGCGVLVARHYLPFHQRNCEYRKRPCKWTGCGAMVVFNVLAAHEGACTKREVSCPHDGCNVGRIPLDMLASHQRKCEYRLHLCKWAGCGAKVASNTLTAHETFCTKREVGCPNDGCNESRIAFDVLVAHQLTCEYRLRLCKWASCGASVINADLEAHESTCTKRLVLCPHPGCNESRIPFDVLALHQRTCTKRLVLCPHPGCNESHIPFDGLEAHQLTCEYRQLPCKWAGCGTSLAIAALAAHENKCVKREVGCPNNGCNANRIAFDVLAVHRRTCQFETVACPYVSVGCTAYMQRKDVDAHKRDAMGMHNELLLAEVCGLRQEASASKEVSTLKREAAEETLEAKAEMSTLKEEGAKEMSAMQEKVHALTAEVGALKEHMITMKKEAAKEVIVMKIKHAELTGAEPFAPLYPALPTRIYSVDRVVDGRTFSVFVDTNDASHPDHYGIYLKLMSGPLPCKIKWTMQMLHHDGRAASAKVESCSGRTYETYIGWGYNDFVLKARLADAVANPYVDNGYVTFTCTFEVVE